MTQKDAAYFLNTGVWGIRPDRRIWHSMRKKLRAGRFKCHVGDQTVAMDHLPRDPTRRNSNGSLANLITTLHVGYNLKAGLGAHACLNKLGSEEVSKNGVNGSVGSVDTHAHVLHWSGSRKPWTIDPRTVRRRIREPTERRALSAFMGQFCRWIDNSTAARLFEGRTRCPLNKLGSEEFSKNGVNGSVGSAAGGRLSVDTHAHVLHWSGPRKP